MLRRSLNIWNIRVGDSGTGLYAADMTTTARLMRRSAVPNCGMRARLCPMR
jgi:hypothetical protein